ncbi:MAG: ABC transporter ATP-binding protein [Oceanospirillales bacterium]|uniref:Amino acid/amide ABC transporter ATP-binding protein 2 (HAAT family) n=1 Tax=Marinobacterium halophilum TaxID=267374 RepID=A0A2P8ETX1_9GAMM|nr:ABC transporter ATP-binding protein [Marinobacterium halophilum]MBR9829471.1 ABC transporter ATP-binding protein [Oceanospirillales bacterium]PSL12892.1 amino acid/amide ABC transporter ATP-binding protein 2 (HAAT family) [Marinobacterium halophilum]
MTKLLEVKGLHTYYDESHILHGVSFAIEPGQAVSLMGRNGMGKTTTLKSILGLVPPRSGHVIFQGEEISHLPTWQRMRKDIAYVPEGRGMFHNLTVREHLEMAARPNQKGEQNWTVERVLDTFPRLQERLTNLGTQLSGGEQQMLAIGRALVTNPDLLILDEATEGLAPLIRKEIWDVVRSIKESGISTLIVDKNIQVLKDLCDQHIVLVKGQVVFSAGSSQLMQSLDEVESYLGV